jgi:hypothetical protein
MSFDVMEGDFGKAFEDGDDGLEDVPIGHQSSIWVVVGPLLNIVNFVYAA